MSKRRSASSTLEKLIAAHNAAFEKWGAAIDAEGKAAEALSPWPVPIALDAAGNSAKWLDLRLHDVDEIRAEILVAANESQKRVSMVRSRERPYALDEQTKEINAARRRSLQTLDKAVSLRRTDKKTKAHARAVARRENAHDDAEDALFEVIMCRPKNRAEAHAKARHLEDHDVVGQGPLLRRVVNDLCRVA